jgi:hypothetical protein
MGTAKPAVTPTEPKANRPLDPAIDPNRDYSYKTKRGGKTFTMSYSGGPPVRVPPLGRGSTLNDARATIVGSTVRIGPAGSSKAKSESSNRSDSPRPPGLYVCPCQLCTAADNFKGSCHSRSQRRSLPPGVE